MLWRSSRVGSERRGPARRAGIAAVEMAVVAPFLALIIMGMFELSRAVMVVELIDDAARKGCNTGYNPVQYDLVKVQVAVPASTVLWFSPRYFAPITHALYSSQVVMMRAG